MRNAISPLCASDRVASASPRAAFRLVPVWLLRVLRPQAGVGAARCGGDLRRSLIRLKDLGLGCLPLSSRTFPSDSLLGGGVSESREARRARSASTGTSLLVKSQMPGCEGREEHTRAVGTYELEFAVRGFAGYAPHTLRVRMALGKTKCGFVQ